MHDFMELFPLCLCPVGVAHEFALSPQIPDAGGAATAAVAQSGGFLAEKEEKSLWNALSGLDPNANCCNFDDGLALLLLCADMATARFVFILQGNKLFNEWNQMRKIVLKDLQSLCKELEPETLEKAHKNIHGISSWQLKVNTHYADILL